jgi:sugar O-acyltransferase (sialic acid O-acetyltransferase NeuD family)
MSKKKLFIIGSGGHAGVIEDILNLNKISITGIIDDKITNNKLNKYKFYRQSDFLKKFNPDSCLLLNGIGNIHNSSKRKDVRELFHKSGYKFTSAIHPSSIISKNSKIASDAQIMAGAILNNGVIINENCIINTGVIIEHDCKIGSGCHIAPGAILCGGVKLENDVFIGANSTIIQNQTITESSFIKASSLIIGKN